MTIEPSLQRSYIAMCGEPFAETLAFFVDELNMRVMQLTPADDPRVAMIEGDGLRIRIDRALTTTPPITIESGAAPSVVAPNGVEVSFVDPAAREGQAVAMPDLEPELVVCNADSGHEWVTGRAGMQYRDLIPSRLGGRYIASHIEVCDGGEVPDLVHHHAVRFQMIFCHQGWVDVVYEDQGEPFRMHPGDCVLQPPHIRHRVLASSAGAKVIEIGCPAEHDTFFDHDLELPTSVERPDRDFGGQRFVRHQASAEPWIASPHPGFAMQRTAIAAATDGLASVRVLRCVGQNHMGPSRHDHEFWFLFVLDGEASFAVEGAATGVELHCGDSVAIPSDLTWCLRDASADLRLLEVVVA